MKPSEVLRAARKLIERPENWTNHVKCGCGAMCPPDSANAVLDWKYQKLYAQCDKCLLAEMAEASKVHVAYSAPGRRIVETPEFMVAKSKLGLPGNDTRKP